MEPPICQRCGDKEGSVVFLDLWILCPGCWVQANDKKAWAHAEMGALDEVALMEEKVFGQARLDERG